ncbi:hypothetical protein JOF53_006602 [Crossiella equi]|uniref:Uncharacterized protein n=1 Tax=Crossiella equi TaxID=130796 RepID=A0ABS5APX7_9PSEU|nr:hypothetical protein [Crossiella equi]MBP2477730.1 hypothetical protein [Crossiella equi]
MTETIATEASSAPVLQELASVAEAASAEPAGRRIEIKQKVGRNKGIMAGVYNACQRVLDHHHLPVDYVQRLASTFASSLCSLKAEEKLKQHNTVVLIADADCGRHHTAVALLSRLAGIEPREVRREVEDKLDLNALELERNKGWLLDLRGEPSLYYQFGRHLTDFRAQLKSRNSYLIVIVPTGLWRQASEGAGDIAVLLEPVPAADIVTAHLSGTNIAPESYLNDSKIGSYLGHAKPADAALWAEHIQAAESVDSRKLPGAQQTDGVDEIRQRRIELVLQLHGGWRHELLQWHKGRAAGEGTREKHFLLATAALEELPAGLIFTTSLETPEVLGEKNPDLRGLAGPGILELVDIIDARLEGDDTVHFARPGYADAVLDYYWLDRYHLRETFTAWLCGLPVNLAGDKKLKDFAPHVADRVANYALRWTIERRNTSLLWQVIRTWSSHPILTEALPLLLTAAALEESYGNKVRDDMLTKAKPDGEVPEVQAIIATVCGGEMAELHPTPALRRLAALAQSSDERVVSAVTASVEKLWNIPALRARLTKAVAGWCKSEGDEHRKAGMNAFLALASLRADNQQLPALLAGGPTTLHGLFDECVHGWRAVFDLRAEREDHVAAVLHLWVSAACGEPALLEWLQRVLHEAVRGGAGQPVNGRTTYYFSRMLSAGDRTPADQVSPQFRQVRDQIVEYVFDRLPQFEALRPPASIAEPLESPPHG